MKRLNLVVEGQAEETFVQECLTRHLAQFNVAAVPRRVEFGRKKGHIYRGGLLEYPKLRKDVVNWLNQDKTALVTTFVDLYALPSDFPGREEGKKIINPFERVAHLENQFGNDLKCNRFIPHIQLHEFEAILFTDIGRLSDYYPQHQDGVNNLIAEAANYKSPELINEGKTTAPSKRILREVASYEKVLAGSVVALELGLPLIREKCAHFDAWLTALEQLDA